jgi:hypothetical protein
MSIVAIVIDCGLLVASAWSALATVLYWWANVTQPVRPLWETVVFWIAMSAILVGGGLVGLLFCYAGIAPDDPLVVEGTLLSISKDEASLMAWMFRISIGTVIFIPSLVVIAIYLRPNVFFVPAITTINAGKRIRGHPGNNEGRFDRPRS